MIPVDLNRLREAMCQEPESEAIINGVRSRRAWVNDAARAVLDAPTVWVVRGA